MPPDYAKVHGMDLKARAQSLKSDIPALVLALKDPRTGWKARLLAALCVAYALSPVDLIPDFIPVVGYLDDLVVLPLLVAATVKFIPKDVYMSLKERQAEARLESKWTYAIPVIIAYAIIIALIVLAIL